MNNNLLFILYLTTILLCAYFATGKIFDIWHWHTNVNIKIEYLLEEIQRKEDKKAKVITNEPKNYGVLTTPQQSERNTQ